MDITIIIPVPKSGSNMIRPNIKKTVIKRGRRDVFISLILLFDSYFDVNMISANLVNSDGWIPKGPIPNQLLEPFLMVPIPGINTKINNIMHINNRVLAYFLYIVYGILDVIKIVI